MPIYYQKHRQIKAIQFDGTIKQLIENFPDWALTFCQDLANQIEYDDHHLIQSIQPIDPNLSSQQFHWWPQHAHRNQTKYKTLHHGDYIVFYDHVVTYSQVETYYGTGQTITSYDTIKQLNHLKQQVSENYWQKIKPYRKTDPDDYTDIRMLTNHIGPEKDKHYQYLMRRYFNIWPQHEFENQWSKTPIKKECD